MFCQKCGRNIEDNEVVILDKKHFAVNVLGLRLMNL